MHSFETMMMKIDPLLRPVGDYFQSTYIGKTWSPPLFPPRLWNVSRRLNNGIPRTSNLVEGWHNRFQHKLGGHSPPIWRLLLELLREQNRTENTYARMEIDRFPNHARKKYLAINVKLKNIYQKKRNLSTMKYLTAIAKYIWICGKYFIYSELRQFVSFWPFYIAFVNKVDFENLHIHIWEFACFLEKFFLRICVLRIDGGIFWMDLLSHRINSSKSSEQSPAKYWLESIRRASSNTLTYDSHRLHSHRSIRLNGRRWVAGSQPCQSETPCWEKHKSYQVWLCVYARGRLYVLWPACWDSNVWKYQLN
jgi:hypothetical protein